MDEDGRLFWSPSRSSSGTRPSRKAPCASRSASKASDGSRSVSFPPDNGTSIVNVLDGAEGGGVFLLAMGRLPGERVG